MRKPFWAFPLVLGMGLFFFSIVFGQTARAGTSDGYRIRYTKCTVVADVDRSLLVKDTKGAASSLKIQHLKKMPQSVTFDGNGISTNGPAGTLYMTGFSIIPNVLIEGDFGKFYTEIRIQKMVCGGVLSSMTGKNTWIDSLAASEAIGSIRISAQANSSNSEYATMWVVAQGSLPYPAMSVQLSGVILEKMVSVIPISSLTVASRKCVTSQPPQRFVSLGGIGRITPAAIADVGGSYPVFGRSITQLKTQGADLAADDLTSVFPISSIRATAVKFNGVRFGGAVGRSDPSQPLVEIKAANFGSIYGDVGVNANLWAGVEGYPDPGFHLGTIQKIATKPTTGFLKGTAHIAPGSTVKFAPASHPYFWICDDPDNDPPQP